MNTVRNTTVAPGDATASKPRPRIGDLEDPIANAIRFTSILADLLDDALSGDSSQFTKLPDTYHLTRDQVENILFLVMMAEREVSSIDAMWMEIVQ